MCGENDGSKVSNFGPKSQTSTKTLKTYKTEFIAQ